MASKTYYAYSNGSADKTNYQGKVVFIETNDDVNNRSTIQYYFYIYRCDGYTGECHKFESGNRIVANIYTFATDYTYPYPHLVSLQGTSESNPHLFYSGSIVVPHRSDGSMSFSFSFTYDQTQNVGQELDYVTVAGTHECTKIARASIPTVSKNSIVLGNSVTINTNRSSNSYTHTLTYSIGSVSETIGTSIGASTTFTPSKDLARQFPDSTSGIITITCKTYSGSSLIGTANTTFTVEISSDMIPTISSVTTAEAATLPSGITGYVKGKSKLKITVSAAGSYGSSIVSYSIKTNGETHSESPAITNTLTTAGTNAITVVVTDSRGKKSETSTTNITVLSYSTPYLSSVSVYRCVSSTNSTESDVGEYMAIVLKGAVSSLNSKNAKTCTVYYKTTSATSWLSSAVTLSTYSINNTVILAASADNAYDIKVSVADSFTEITYDNYHVGTTFTLGNVNTSGRGIAWGGVCQSDSFEVYMDEKHYGESEFTNISFSGDIHGKVISLNNIANTIPENEDMNDAKYLLPNIWAIRGNSVAKTLTNLPSTYAGIFITYSATGANNTDTSKTYYYARQEYIPFLSTYGHYERSIYSSDVGGEFVYNSWRRIAYTDEITSGEVEGVDGLDIAPKSVTTTGSITSGSSLKTNTGIEISAATPYIDFHFANSTEDYTVRLIESQKGLLTLLGNLATAGTITANTFDGTIVKTGTVTATGVITCQSVTQTSDERFKIDIDNVPDVYLALVDKISPKIFRFKSDNSLNIGLIAQEILAVEKELGISESVLVREITGASVILEDVDDVVSDYYSIDYNAYNLLKSLSFERKIAALQATY